MKPERRHEINEYIAAGIRYAARETMLRWPEETIIVTTSFCELAELDEIIGMKVFIMDAPSSFDFFVAFPSENKVSYKLQKAFLEYLDLYELPESEG